MLRNNLRQSFFSMNYFLKRRAVWTIAHTEQSYKERQLYTFKAKTKFDNRDRKSAYVHELRMVTMARLDNNTEESTGHSWKRMDTFPNVGFSILVNWIHGFLVSLVLVLNAKKTKWIIFFSFLFDIGQVIFSCSCAWNVVRHKATWNERLSWLKWFNIGYDKNIPKLLKCIETHFMKFTSTCFCGIENFGRDI